MSWSCEFCRWRSPVQQLLAMAGEYQLRLEKIIQRLTL